MGDELKRPKTRGDCANSPRPCPWVGCRHHLLLEVTRAGALRSSRGLYELPMSRGRTKPYPRQGIDSVSFEEWGDEAVKKLNEMEHSCALDIAEDGVSDVEEIGGLLGIKKKMTEKVYRDAIIKARYMGQPSKGQSSNG